MSDAQTLTDTLKAYYEGAWNAHVDGLNDGYVAAATLDEIRLRHLARVYTAFTDIKSIPQYPALLVLSNRSLLGNWKAGSESWSHALEIGVLEQHQDADVLDSMLKRYVEDVAWALLKAGHFANSLGGYHLVTSVDEGPLESVQINWGPTVDRDGTMTQGASFNLRMEA